MDGGEQAALARRKKGAYTIELMGFLKHIEACNRHDRAGFCPFVVAGRAVGWIRHALATELPAIDPGFILNADGVAFAPGIDGFDERSDVLARAGETMCRRGVVSELRGEFFPVLAAWGMPPLAKIDRALVTLFGVRAFGLHVNGYVRHADGSLSMWIGVRAKDRNVAPGAYDNMIAGGQPYGLTVDRNLAKEAGEEAGFDPAFAARAVPVGALSYTMETAKGLKTDTMFLYDLETPSGVEPRNTDGEVDHFELWPLDRVADSIKGNGNWKFNVPLVVIDFLIRHGWLKPDNPDYMDIVNGLHR